MAFIVTHPLARLPTFPELQELAGKHDVHIQGDERAGDFCHPNSAQPMVTGTYAFAPNGELRGEFIGHKIGKLTGEFVCTAGKAEITITQKPFLLPEVVLKSKLSDALTEFCARFIPA